MKLPGKELVFELSLKRLVISDLDAQMMPHQSNQRLLVTHLQLAIYNKFKKILVLELLTVLSGSTGTFILIKACSKVELRQFLPSPMGGQELQMNSSQD